MVGGITLSKITSHNFSELSKIYKEVFKGHPWHEDLICFNAKRSLDDPKRCTMQYTRMHCDKHDYNKMEGLIKNDCRGSYEKRDGIVPLRSSLVNCLGCGSKLDLIEFYPDFVDHKELINEALNLRGFIGFILYLGDSPIGFSWGYGIPHVRTKSVNFPLINPLLLEKEINLDKAFYGAETGVIGEYQGKNLGNLLVVARMKEAIDAGFENYLNRTINPYIHSIVEKIFPNQPLEKLFNDPERKSGWHSFDFKNADRDFISRVLKEGCKF